jgi:hypothetical protein
MDEDIRDSVDLALASLLPEGLVVSVKDGVVILQGAVSSDSEVMEATSLACQVEGVKKVINRLTVQQPLHSDEPISGDKIDIVGTNDPIEAAENGEPYFPPTDPVVWPSTTSDEDIEIKGGWAPSAEETPIFQDYHETVQHGDDEITDMVLRELALDAATADLKIDVETVDGMVYLRGRVGSLQEEQTVEEVASRVPGVDEVVDELEIA